MRPNRPVQLTFLVALAVLWRGLMLVHYKMIDTDAAYYGAIARFFAEGHWGRGLDPIWPPFYPFLSSVPLRMGVSPEASGIAVSLLASAGCVVCCYFLAKAIAGSEVGLVAAVVAVIHPRLVIVSQSLLTEAVYLFLAGTSLAFFCHGFKSAWSGPGKRAWAGIFIAGLVLSLAFLTRPEAIVFFGLLVGLTAARSLLELRRRGRAAVRALLVPLLLSAGFAAPALPYLYDVSGTEGRWIIGEKGALNFYLTYRNAYEEERIQVQPSDYAAITGAGEERKPGYYRVGEFIRQRPGLVLSRTLDNLPKALFNKIPSLMYWPLMLLAIAGIVYRRRVPRSKYELLFGAWIVLLALAISPLFLMRRFFAASLPVLIVWSAIGLEEFRYRLGRRVFNGSAAVAVVLICAYTSYSLARRPWPVLYKKAGLWLGRNAAGPVVVTGRKPEVSFYARSEFRPLEVREIERLETFLQQEGITHLVVEDYIMPSTHPRLAYLIEPHEAPAWLEPVFSASKDGHRLVVYRYE
ncbi:MAG: ArnT family glycosyltransferase [Candidatus Krumholzibacteriia bacterium]